MSPVAPFFSDWLYQNLNTATGKETAQSVHLASFPKANPTLIDPLLEERMELAQNISSLTLALRKKVEIKVRQPLQKILVPVLNEQQQQQIERVKDLILSEVNVKELEFITDTTGLVIKKVKPDFKKLGGRLGKNMSVVKDLLEGVKDKQGNVVKEGFTQHQITDFERSGNAVLMLNNEPVLISLDEVIITSEDIPGWQVNSLNGITVALDTTITETLQDEGFARELVNRVQNMRKDQGFKITDRILLFVEPTVAHTEIQRAITAFGSYICSETLAEKLEMDTNLDHATETEVNDLPLKVKLMPV